ncbi:MAG: NTP transferase domain-containing protein, partial [Jannaschia sp.]
SRRAWLGDTPARLIDVSDRAMSASIRAGVAACRADALTIHLADMPEIEASELQTVSDAWSATDAAILRATTTDGIPGQPVTFARALFPELAALTGDGGGRSVLARHPAASVALPGRSALTDLDTPEDWTAWRAARRDPG